MSFYLLPLELAFSLSLISPLQSLAIEEQATLAVNQASGLAAATPSLAIPVQEPITTESPEALDDPDVMREQPSADAAKVNYRSLQTCL